MTDSVCLYQHPTQVIFFSESHALCDSVTFAFSHIRRIKAFTNSKDAIAWLDGCMVPGSDIQIRSEMNALGPRRHFSVETDRIYYGVFDKNRFVAPAVIIVAKDNEKTDGVTFCRQLVDYPIKKVLLLNKFRDFDPTEAFNEGLIDQCIRSLDSAIFTDLEIAIKNMELQYFKEQSKFVGKLLTKGGLNFLSDETFVQLVESLISEHAFVEQYWFDDPNGILFVDADGKCKLMVTKTEANLIRDLEDAEDSGAPVELQDAIRDYRIIPFFPDQAGGRSSQFENWEEYCQPAQRSGGRQPIYWALFDLPQKYLPSDIYSFQRHLET